MLTHFPSTPARAQERPHLKEKHPEATFGDLSKLAGEAWKAISAEDRAKYEKLAETDRKR